MKTKPILTIVAALSVVVLALPSCKKDSTSAQSGLQVSMQANKVATIPAPTVNASQGTISWDTARMWVSSITVEAMLVASQGDSGRPVTVTWNGPQMVDLLNANQIITTIGLPAGTYRSFRYQVVADTADAGKDPVLYLSGTYSSTDSASTKVPVIIEIRDNLTITAQRVNAVIGNGESNRENGIIRVYLERIFSEMLLSRLAQATTTDGTIVISPTSNPELYSLILQRLQGGGSLTSRGNDFKKQ